jgi:hypothetical protein
MPEARTRTPIMTPTVPAPTPPTRDAADAAPRMGVDELREDRAVTVPLVLPYSMLQRVNAVAAESGRNRSAVIREGIAMMLATGSEGVGALPTPAPITPMDAAGVLPTSRTSVQPSMAAT